MACHCAITRCADMLCLQAGDLVEKDSLYRNEQGNAGIRKEMAGEYAMHVQCMYRMTCGDQTIFAQSDLYQPSLAALATLGLQTEDAPPDDFKYDIVGNNRLDEIIQPKFASLEDFIVRSVSINRLGDARIRFTNGFQFQIVVDVSGGQECWRFFANQDERHLVITGEGVDRYCDEE